MDFISPKRGDGVLFRLGSEQQGGQWPVNVPGSASASSRPTGGGSSSPESVDGAMQRLDGGYDKFVYEKMVSVSCILIFH